MDLTRAARARVLAGGALAVVVALAVRPALRGEDALDPTWPVFLLLFASAVHVPVAMRLVATRARGAAREPFAWRAADLLQLPAAALLAASFLFERGAVAALLALPWLVVGALVALFGALRFLERGPWPAEELAIDLGCVHLFVAGIWAVASRATPLPFGFPGVIALHTAIHFTFAGFSLHVVAGMVGRARPRGLPWVVIFGLEAGIAALALGITLTENAVDAGPWIERVAGAIFAATGVAVAILQILARPRAPLLVVSALALAPSILLGATYALHLVPWLTIARMDDLHGSANALGFALLAILGWTLAPPRSRARAPGVPASRLSGDWPMGEGWFERRGLLAPSGEEPRGLGERLEDFLSDGTLAENVHPAVRAFFERISELDLLVLPEWRFGFRTAARAWHAFATRLGQLRLCVAPTRIVTRTFGIDRAKDGRADARGVLRLYEDGGPPLHVAAYATHAHEGARYMSCCFPLPGGQLHGVLRLDEIDHGGVVLTTYPPADRLDDVGIWVIARGLRVRMPMNETVELRPAIEDDPRLPGATLVGRHTMRFFGVTFLSLTYLFRPRQL